MQAISTSASLRPSPCASRPVGVATRKTRRAVVSVQAVNVSKNAVAQENENCSTRRGVLIGGGAAMATPLIFSSEAIAAKSNTREVPVKDLSTFQKADMRAAMSNRAKSVMKEMITADDAAPMMRLVLLDAGTYDVTSKTGGLNASVILSDELPADEKKALQGVIDKLKAAKAEIDSRTETNQPGQGLISWSDLLVLAGSIAIREEWKRQKIARAADEESGKLIAENFGTAWDVKLGRIDSTEPEKGGLSVPASDASIEEIKGWLNKLGNKKAGEDAGFLAPKPPFWERPGFLIWSAGQLDPAAAEEYLAQDPGFAEFKAKYDKSRRTVTRTDYEVDFIDYYTRLTSYAKFDADAYCFPLEVTTKL